MAAADPPPERIVIVGGGIIGCSTAFYLSQMGAAEAVTVVERGDIACAASGKAGGFLALDWNDGTPVGALARASFELHKELADAFGADSIGYRPVETLAVTASEAAPQPSKKARRGHRPLPEWLAGGHATETAALGSPATTAQVHPHKLTHALMSAAQQQGAQQLRSAVTGLQLEDDAEGGRRVTGVHTAAGTVPCDAVVLAMGPWSDVAAREWGLPLPRIQGQAYHSIVLPQRVPGHAIFTEFHFADGRDSDPEVYPRPDGTVYVCGEAQSPRTVTEDPLQVPVKEELCRNLESVAGSLSPALQGLAPVAKQACNLPLGPDAMPIIGRVPGVQGAFVATAHSCWGILNGPATGKALAEFIVHGKASSVDLSPFSPARFL